MSIISKLSASSRRAKSTVKFPAESQVKEVDSIALEAGNIGAREINKTTLSPKEAATALMESWALSLGLRCEKSVMIAAESSGNNKASHARSGTIATRF